VHLLMAFVRNVPVEVRAALGDDTPAIAATRWKRHPDHIVAGTCELPHLLMAFIRYISVEEYDSHGNHLCRLCGARNERDLLPNCRLPMSNASEPTVCAVMPWTPRVPDTSRRLSTKRLQLGVTEYMLQPR